MALRDTHMLSSLNDEHVLRSFYLNGIFYTCAMGFPLNAIQSAHVGLIATVNILSTSTSFQSSLLYH